MLRTRYLRILRFFAGIILGVIWWDLVLPRLGLRRLTVRSRPRRFKRIAVDFRALAIQMGGVMIKVGQFLSARLDVLPREITDELAGLQDEVRPETFADIRKVLEGEFKGNLAERYTWIEETPLAAASIGQVHRARLFSKDGNEQPNVVVKVQRPNIEAIVAVDLSALRVVSRWVNRYEPIRRRISVPALMEEFSVSLLEEIDYLLEGKNAEKFAENFRNDARVNVPHVFWSHTTRRVLTLEDVGSIKISDYAALEAAGLNRKEVAARLFDTYLKQIFEDRFFHADPHPGNLFVLPRPDVDEGAWNLVFIDFGMVGRLPESLLTGLTEALIALGTQDAARLVRSYQQLKILLPGADVEIIEKASAAAFSRFWGRTAPELAALGHEEIAAFAEEFGDVLYEMPFQIPENFILLGRCMGILSGICSGLDPDFNIWTQIAPYAQKLVEAERGGSLQFFARELVDTLRLLAALPRRTENLLNRLEQGRLSVQTPDLKIQATRVELALQRLTAALVFAAAFLGAVQLYIAGATMLSEGAGGLALLAFIWLILMR